MDIAGTSTKRGLSQGTLFLISFALHIFTGVTFSVILGFCFSDNTTLQGYLKAVHRNVSNMVVQRYPQLVPKTSTVHIFGSFLELNMMIGVFYVWALVVKVPIKLAD